MVSLGILILSLVQTPHSLREVGLGRQISVPTSYIMASPHLSASPCGSSISPHDATYFRKTSVRLHFRWFHGECVLCHTTPGAEVKPQDADHRPPRGVRHRPQARGFRIGSSKTWDPVKRAKRARKGGGMPQRRLSAGFFSPSDRFRFETGELCAGPSRFV